MLLLTLFACVSGLEPVEPDRRDPILPDDEVELVGLSISPTDPVLSVGDVIQLAALAHYDDGSTEDVTRSVTFSSSDLRVVVVDSTGRLEGASEGSSEISAVADDGTDAAMRVTVIGEDIFIESYALSPASMTLSEGDSAAFVVNAIYSDGSHGNVSGSCDWSSDTASVAAVDGLGNVTAQAAGETTVRAACEGDELAGRVTVEAEEVEIGQADLRIRSFDADVLSGDVVYSLVVENRGTALSSGFYVDAFLDLDSAPTAGIGTYDTTEFVPGLAPGEETEVTLELTSVTPGTYDSWVYADTDEWITETDESNNAAGPVTVVVEEPLLGPDLEITWLDGATDGSFTYYVIDISNVGDEPAVDFYVDLYTDRLTDPDVCEYGDEWVHIAQLDPWETFTWEPELEAGPTLWWDTVVFADSCDAVAEQDETDNLAFITLFPE